MDQMAASAGVKQSSLAVPDIGKAAAWSQTFIYTDSNVMPLTRKIQQPSSVESRG
jgi:hypothetical protein